MNKKAEINIPENKLKIALVVTIIVFALVFALVVVAVIFGPGKIEKFVSNPTGSLEPKNKLDASLQDEMANSNLSCKDSDGGQEFDVAGEVINSSGAILIDSCNSQKELKEYYCQNGNVKSVTTQCANTCMGGYCSGYNWTCLDSDKGINLSVLGIISGVQMQLNRLTFTQDSCIDSPNNITAVGSSNFINEYFCSGKYINSSIYGCSSGCTNGVCLGNTSLMNCASCLTQHKNYSCFSGTSASCSNTFNSNSCTDCRIARCGDGKCDFGENYSSCSVDCKIQTCGNKFCNYPFENEINCPTDCLYHCGDGYCDDSETNSSGTIFSCTQDCNNDISCGNGVCEPPSENAGNCPVDCADMCTGGVGIGSGTGGSGGGGTGGSGTVLSSGLVAYYNFDGNAQDSSGSGNNGVVSGGASYVPGKIGQAIDFNGISQYVNFANSDSLKLGNRHTISGWIYIKGRVEGEIIGKWCGTCGYNGLSEDRSYSIAVKEDGKLEYSISTSDKQGDAPFHIFYSNAVLPLNQWVFFAVTYDGTRRTIYINGAEDSYVDKPGNIYQSNAEIQIGADHDAGYRGFFKGSIDDIRVYNRLLSPSEIASLYASGGSSTTGTTTTGQGCTSCTTSVEEHSVCSGNLINSTTLSSYTDCPLYCGNLGAACFVTTGNNWNPNCNCYDGHVSVQSLSQNGWSGGNCVGGGVCATIGGVSNSCSSGLEGYWKLDESSGEVLDSSRNSLNGQINGAVSETSGKIGNALYFTNSVSDYVSIPADPKLNFGGNKMTISAWVNQNAGGEAAVFSQRDNCAAQTNIQLYSQEWNVCSGNPAAQISEWDWVCGSSPISLNAWHYIVGTYDGTTEKIYVDGVLSGSRQITDNIRSGAFTNRIGYDTCGSSFKGKIDEVSLWNRALSASEISNLYNNGNGKDVCSSGGSITGSAITGNVIAPFSKNYLTGFAVSSSTDYCGDGACSNATCETAYNCPADCTGSTCGNHICENGETYANCVVGSVHDCPLTTCGDGVCEKATETVRSCPTDCLIRCGNKVCEFGESSICPEDCGTPCTSDINCAYGEICRNNKCVLVDCVSDSDCGIKRCIGGQCLTRCTSDAGCEDNQRCTAEGSCVLISSLKILNPNGGEILMKGGRYAFTWDATGINKINLTLVPELTSGTTKNIVMDSSASRGFYNWTIPADTVEGRYKVRIVNKLNANEQDSSDNYFTIAAAPTTLPRIDSISVTNAVPGNSISISGEGFDLSNNRVLFKIVSSPFTYYNGKSELEYWMDHVTGSGDGRTLQFSIPTTLYSLNSNEVIPTIPGTYQIVVSNESTGDIRSNPIGITIPNYLNIPTNIVITSPKAGDVWSVGEQKAITWDAIENVGRVSLYVQTIPYRAKDNDKRTIYYFKTINYSILQSGGSLDWKITNFGDADMIASTYTSAEQIYDVPWIPLDGNLQSYILIAGEDTHHLLVSEDIIYKDLSDNFTLDTPIEGSCNECPANGYLTCDGTGSRKVCNADSKGCLKWSTTSCPQGQSCVNGVCGGGTSGRCTPGQRKCVGTNAYDICSSSGTWSTVSAALCPAQQICSGEGVCGGTCSSGEKRCVGTSGYQTCSSSGTWGSTVTPCSGAGQTCSGNGVCSGGICGQPNPGAWYDVSPAGKVRCESFCASKGLQSTGDFAKTFDSWNNGPNGNIGMCYTLGGSPTNSFGSEGIGDYVAGDPTIPGDYAYCISGIVQGSVAKCFCRAMGTGCPSGQYCQGNDCPDGQKCDGIWIGYYDGFNGIGYPITGGTGVCKTLSSSCNYKAEVEGDRGMGNSYMCVGTTGYKTCTPSKTWSSTVTPCPAGQICVHGQCG